jgi:hypothetical protein
MSAVRELAPLVGIVMACVMLAVAHLQQRATARSAAAETAGFALRPFATLDAQRAPVA